MFILHIKKALIFLLILLPGCDFFDLESIVHKNINHENLIFKYLYLNNPQTFGTDEILLGKKPSGFDNKLTNTVLGLNENIYQNVIISSDGNAWIRSVTHAILHQMFLNHEIYNKITDKIKNISGYYEKHKGDNRYIHISPDSINLACKLFEKLKDLDEEKRLELYNKSAIDQYIIMLFRTIYAIVVEEYFPEDLIIINKLLTWQSGADTSACAGRLQYYFAVRLWSIDVEHGFSINKVGYFGVLPNLESTQLIILAGINHSTLLRRINLNDRAQQIARRSDFFPLRRNEFYNSCMFYKYLFEDDPNIVETRYSRAAPSNYEGTFLHAFFYWYNNLNQQNKSNIEPCKFVLDYFSRQQKVFSLYNCHDSLRRLPNKLDNNSDVLRNEVKRNFGIEINNIRCPIPLKTGK